MAIDCVTPGYTPFQGFDLTTNFDQYLKLFDRLEAYDFTTFLCDHLIQIGTKQDVEIAREFAVDVYQTVKRIHNNMDQNAVVAEPAKTIGTDESTKELSPRWINRLAGVDVWLESIVRAALIYVSWDDKLS